MTLPAILAARTAPGSRPTRAPFLIWIPTRSRGPRATASACFRLGIGYAANPQTPELGPREIGQPAPLPRQHPKLAS